MELTISSHQQDGVLTIAVAGDLDLLTCPTLDTAILQALSTAGVTAVRVDLSSVEFLDSSAIALLLKGHRAAHERGIGYQVTGAQGVTRVVLEVTGVWEHLSGRPDDHQANQR
jgi:anti-sigma B factor antagonist